MILIALLIAFSIERVYSAPAAWHLQFYFQRWLQWIEGKFAQRAKQHRLQQTWVQWLLLFGPALLAGSLVSLLDHGLVDFIAGIIALFVSSACQPARAAYKAYLQAANKGDDERREIHRQQLQEWAGIEQPKPVNQLVCWINYQQYLAVIFFFLLFGVFGALAYASIRAAASHYREHFEQIPLDRLRWAVDAIPVRLAGLGLLVVGHFSRALPVWLNNLTNLNTSNIDNLSEVAERAEDTPHHPDDRTDATVQQLKMMKRQQLLWLCVIALLTLAGGLH